MSLQTPATIRRLQRKLYVKAKQEPEYRFYLLYDKGNQGTVYLSLFPEMRDPSPMAHGGAPGAVLDF